ncbi:hypothetical protein KKH3_03490 [Pectobacterium actinidiae]|nr:hypothetical protein KKH3_03490 [Pectobacterium actinidiae]
MIRRLSIYTEMLSLRDEEQGKVWFHTLLQKNAGFKAG